MGFEWDFEGGHFMRRAIFCWDLEGGHFMRSEFNWDFEGGGAFYEARYHFGWDFAHLTELTMLQAFYTPELTHRASRALSS